VDAWIDHSILNTFTLSADALRISAYYFKNRGGKIEMGPLWDFDRAMGTDGAYSGDWRPWNPRAWIGNDGYGGSDYGTDFFNPAPVFQNPWYGRLFTDIDFWQRWIDRYQELRAGAFSSNSIFGLVDFFGNEVSTGHSREVAKWSGLTSARSGQVTDPNGFYTHTFPGTYAGEIAFQKRWLGDRLNFMDTNFLARPTFNSAGGSITQGFILRINAPAMPSGSTLYYTLDGTDPRAFGGAVSPSALSASGTASIPLNANARVTARAYNAAHQNLTGDRNPPLSSSWSGPVAATFVVATPPLMITELMYHPVRPASGTNNNDDFEFIELKNTGSQPLNLPGFRFVNGIEFQFTATNAVTQLDPGQYTVLVRNTAAFLSRYPGVPVAGQYTGSLNNSGERIELVGPAREAVLEFEFHPSWYPATDGNGFSFVARNESGPAADWNSALAWRASTFLGGSPGTADPTPQGIPPIVLSETLTHTDLPDLDAVEL